MDPLAAIRDTFFQECDEQLAELESGLLAIQGGDHDPERVNAVFRAVHSIKGGAGAFGLEPLVRFAHVFETTLDCMRSGSLVSDDTVLTVMLRAADLLADHVAAAQGGAAVDEARSLTLASELSALIGVEGIVEDSGAEDFDIAFQPLQFDAPPLDLPDLADLSGAVEILPSLDAPAIEVAAAEADDEDSVGPQPWTIRLKPGRALYAHANETALLLRELGRLGEASVSLDDSELPTLDGLSPGEGYLTWSVTLVTDGGESEIREVFEFVDGHLDLVIEAAGGDGEEPPAQPGASAESDFDVSALIRKAQQAAEAAPQAGPIQPTPPAAAVIPLSAPIAAAPTPAPEWAGEAAADSGKGAGTASAAPATIRVDLERVDRLINLVGELVINQAVLAQRAAESGLARQTEIAMGLDDLEQLTREIQDSVMAIRAQPVKSVFQRMPRLVREVAAAVGKQVRLVTEGENTEVDKTVIERLSDPITHMIRNAIDHGLETPEKRLAAGKPAEGKVRLAAFHRGGRIVIEVSDDGAGINRGRVRDLAVSKGLIDPNLTLTDEEIDNLIFLPGFSTASAVSNISGRGVGMDVVKRSIAALGGRIAIVSNPGKGSTFTLSLPLTLAVLDGMVVAVSGQTLVAPLSAIVETLQPKAAEVKRIGATGWLMAIRDSFVPLIDVGMAMGFRTQPLEPTRGVALLVEGEGGARAALLVDDIQGQRQVVIKSLEANYRHVPGIAAATILGDGRVALILDVDAVVARRAEAPRETTPLLAAG